MRHILTDIFNLSCQEVHFAKRISCWPSSYLLDEVDHFAAMIYPIYQATLSAIPVAKQTLRFCLRLFQGHFTISLLKEKKKPLPPLSTPIYCHCQQPFPISTASPFANCPFTLTLDKLILVLFTRSNSGS